MKKALFIGGTGTISSAVTARLAAEGEWELTLLNRGNRRAEVPENVRLLQTDIHDEAAVARLLGDAQWDCVAEFIGYRREQVERDVRLFRGRTAQYIFISSASAYRKPPQSPFITEETPLENPFWQYSRDKIACERYLFGPDCADFPVTVVRPSHTYGDRSVPLGVHGAKGSWQVLRRMLDGKRVLIHGDGTSQWTLTHNSDFARGFVGLMGQPEAIGEAYHITSDETLTWNRIYADIAEALGVELKACHAASEFLDAAGPYDFRGSLIGDKANNVFFDNAKIKRAVPGFRAEVPFREGVKRTVAYILAHPECQVPDPEFDAWCDRVIDALDRAR